MNGTPSPGPSASGDRSVAAQTISGTVTTGDNTRIVTLEPGTIPAPGQVAITAPINNLPRPPALVFKGRDTTLGVLGRTLAADASVVVTQAVYGLGGVGKSELALQHAHAHRGDYKLVWWITAADGEQVEAGLAALAGRLCPPIALAGSTQDAAAWALGWLQGHGRWLLILDNVDDPADVEGLLGQLRGGHIVLTTRRDVDWQRIASPIRLDILAPEPAAQIITTRTAYTSGQDQADAAAVAAELGFLPLALDQAAAYMIQARIRPGQYLAKLRRHPARMHAATAGQAQQTITRLWDITIDAIRDHDPGAIRLLQILACYAPDNIPRAILDGQGDTGQNDEQLGLLASYSMITLTPETVSMHRLVQAVALAKHPAEEEGLAFDGEDPATTALRWLDGAIPADPGTNMTGWRLLRSLITHVEQSSGRFPSDDRPELLGRVQNELAVFHRSQGQYEQSLTLRKSALAIYEATHGPHAFETAIALSNLANTYWLMGQPNKALPLVQRALKIIEAAFGPDHPNTANALNSLGLTYNGLGQPDKALPLMERGLKITEAALGPDHPSTANRLDNMAVTYRDLGQPDKALPLQQRALKITEAALGPDHPSTAIRLGNLALTYRDLGQPDKALPLQQRALKITEAAFGPDHPGTAITLGNLALTYRDVGQPDKALPLQQRAQRIKTQTAVEPSDTTES